MDSSSLLLRCVPDTRRRLNGWQVVRAPTGLPTDRGTTVVTPVPFGTTTDSGIAEPTRTLFATHFGEPEATRTLFQRVSVPRRLKTSQADSCSKAIHRGPR